MPIQLRFAWVTETETNKMLFKLSLLNYFYNYASSTLNHKSKKGLVLITGCIFHEIWII